MKEKEKINAANNSTHKVELEMCYGGVCAFLA